MQGLGLGGLAVRVRADQDGAVEDLQRRGAHVLTICLAARAVGRKLVRVQRRVVRALPGEERVPFGVHVPPRLGGDEAAGQRREALGLRGRGQQVAHVGAALPLEAVGREGAQAGGGGLLEEAKLLLAHGADHGRQAVELHVHHGALEFRGARAVGGEGHEVGAPVPVEAAAVNHAGPALGGGPIVSHEGSALAGGHVLKKLKLKAPASPIAPTLFPL